MNLEFKHLADVFLDRDGTIIEDRHYAASPEDIALLPGAGDALASLSRAGSRFFVVSNQSGIGRGYFSPADLEACHNRLQDLLAAYGVFLTAFRYCPHDPMLGPCGCRKPQIGLWTELQREFGLNPRHCLMVGDKLDDLRFGQRAGFAASALVLTGQGSCAAAGLDLLLPPELDALPFSLGSEYQQNHQAQAPNAQKKFDQVALRNEETRLFVTRDLSALSRMLLEEK